MSGLQAKEVYESLDAVMSVMADQGVLGEDLVVRAVEEIAGYAREAPIGDVVSVMLMRWVKDHEQH